MGLRGNKGVDNGGSCSDCALLSFLQLVCPPPGCVPDDYFRFERLEPYSESPGQVRLDSALVAMLFARVHSSALQS